MWSPSNLLVKKIKKSIDNPCVISVYITHEQLKRALIVWRNTVLKILQNSGTPIYQQIFNQLKEEILTGKYEDGEYLPSIRGLAQDLRISVITTLKAYEQLQSEGLVTAVQGKGYYVNAQNSEMLKEQHMRKVEESLLDAIRAAKIAGMSGEELLETLAALQAMEET